MSLTPVLQPACTTLSPITSTTPYMEYPGILGTHLLYAMPSVVSDFMSLGAQAICAQAQTVNMCAFVPLAAGVVGSLQEWAWGAQYPACKPVSFDAHTNQVFWNLFVNNELNNIPDKYKAVLSTLTPAQQAKVAELIAKVGIDGIEDNSDRASESYSGPVALLSSSASTLISSTSALISTESMLFKTISDKLVHYKIGQWLFGGMKWSYLKAAAVLNVLASIFFTRAVPAAALEAAVLTQPATAGSSLGYAYLYGKPALEAASEIIAENKLKTMGIVGIFTGIQVPAKVMASLEKASSDVTGIEPEVLYAATLGAILKTIPSLEDFDSIAETSPVSSDVFLDTCPIPHFSAHKQKTINTQNHS